MSADCSVGSIFEEKYEILQEINEGGFGRLFKARHLELDRIVAIKILRPELLGDQENRARFKIEGRILANLNQPNVAQFFHFGVTRDRRAYIVMEFLNGFSLTDVCKKSGGRISATQVITIGMQACDGLQAVHEKGIVHRDLKPSNMMLVPVRGQKEQVKLIDFGLSRVLSSSQVSVTEHLTKTGLLIGSVNYMSPEQCIGRSVDQRSDLYSLGCVLFELVAGRQPFDAENPIGLLNQHLTATPPSFSQLGVSAPAGLEVVIHKALCKDRALRYQSAVEMKADLVLVQAGKGRGLKAPDNAFSLGRMMEDGTGSSPSANKGKTRREQRLRVLLAAVIAGLFLAVGSLSLVLTRQQHLEATGIVCYLNLDRVPVKDREPIDYIIKEVHLMCRAPSASAARIVKFESNLTTGNKFYENLRLGKNWTCKAAQNGSLADILPQKGGSQEQIYGAWICLVEFLRAIDKADWVKAGKLTDRFHCVEGSRYDKDGLKRSWHQFKFKNGAIGGKSNASVISGDWGKQDIATVLGGGDPYAEKPLPQCIKVVRAGDESVQLLLDKSLIFTRNGLPITDRLVQRFTINFLVDSWGIEVIGGENEDSAVADWDKY